MGDAFQKQQPNMEKLRTSVSTVMNDWNLNKYSPFQSAGETFSQGDVSFNVGYDDDGSEPNLRAHFLPTDRYFLFYRFACNSCTNRTDHLRARICVVFFAFMYVCM